MSELLSVLASTHAAHLHTTYRSRVSLDVPFPIAMLFYHDLDLRQAPCFRDISRFSFGYYPQEQQTEARNHYDNGMIEPSDLYPSVDKLLSFPDAVEDSRRSGEGVGGCDSSSSLLQEQYYGCKNVHTIVNPVVELKNKRKRPTGRKTNEQVESQRLTHIAVERNRRKQMNEHLGILRSLMPGSYAQRGDQASIIGGAIEFVRELEQLLQCLESQKWRRRTYGENASQIMGSSLPLQTTPSQPPKPLHFPPFHVPPVEDDETVVLDHVGRFRKEMAEIKSSVADVEVKVFGFDAIIKILSGRRPCQLIKTIAALQELELNVLHTNITTIDQTVLYSFNVKVASECGFTAEGIATSVQQIFRFIHAHTGM